MSDVVDTAFSVIGDIADPIFNALDPVAEAAGNALNTVMNYVAPVGFALMMGNALALAAPGAGVTATGGEMLSTQQIASLADFPEAFQAYQAAGMVPSGLTPAAAGQFLAQEGGSILSSVGTGGSGSLIDSAINGVTGGTGAAGTVVPGLGGSSVIDSTITSILGEAAPALGYVPTLSELANPSVWEQVPSSVKNKLTQMVTNSGNPTGAAPGSPAWVSILGALAPSLVNAIDPAKAPTWSSTSNSTGSNQVAGSTLTNTQATGATTSNTQGGSTEAQQGRGTSDTTQTTTYSPEEQAVRDAQLRAATSTYNAAINPAGPEAALLRTMQESARTGLVNAQDVRNNPYFTAALEAALRPVTQNFTETVLPAIRGDALSSGQYGGTRQGLAEGLAASRLDQTLADAAATMGSRAYDQGQSTFVNLLNTSPTVLNASSLPLTNWINTSKQVMSPTVKSSGETTTNNQANTNSFANVLGTTQAATTGNTANTMNTTTSNANTQSGVGAQPQSNLVGDALSGMLLANQAYNLFK